MDISSLRESGLTDGEIKVYLALLELGSSTTGPIIDKSGIARSIIYQILERLIQKGLVSYITKEDTRYFQASEPNKILDYIEEKEKGLLLNKKRVQELLPQLLLKQAESKKSTVNVYIGMKGLITAHEHIYLKMKKGDEYCYMGIPAYQPETHHLYWQRDHARRAKAGIIGRLLFNKDTPRKVLENRNKYPLADARYMPSEIKTPSYYCVYKDTLILFILNDEPTVIEIINQQIADSFQAYFEEFWKQTKRFR